MSWQADLLESARRAARLLRFGMEAQASEEIVAIVGALEAAPREELEPLSAVIDGLSAAQRRRDLLRLADLFEYDLPAALAGAKA